MTTLDSSENNETPETEPSSSETLLPQVYEELRRVAQNKMNNESGHQTLSATALVHEAYLRISERDLKPEWQNKSHFFAAAAEAMRRILIDRARAKLQQKRGGDLKKVELFESQVVVPAKNEELLAVNDALEIFEVEDPESAELVKLRYFAGMSWKEISEVTGIPDRTLRRRWTYAKVWLQERIERER